MVQYITDISITYHLSAILGHFGTLGSTVTLVDRCNLCSPAMNESPPPDVALVATGAAAAAVPTQK